MQSNASAVPIESVSVAAYTIPTDSPESDGTLEWDSTALLALVRVNAGGLQGLGYSYADTATARLIQDELARLLVAYDAFAINRRWMDMVAALWDLKGKLLDLPLAVLLGMARPSILIYGSGGITGFIAAAAQRAIHLEYFHDHARIERMLFDGAPLPEHGKLKPDLTRPGLGIEFRDKDAECFRL